MISEPVQQLNALAGLHGYAGAAAQIDALNKTWRDYRWTIGPVKPDFDLSSSYWRDAIAVDAVHRGYGWDERFVVIPDGEVWAGLSYDFPRYPADTTYSLVGLGEVHTRIDTDAITHESFRTSWNDAYENRTPKLNVKFSDVEGALIAAIASADAFIGAVS